MSFARFPSRQGVQALKVNVAYNLDLVIDAGVHDGEAVGRRTGVRTWLEKVELSVHVLDAILKT
jgi:hypothetical protein